MLPDLSPHLHTAECNRLVELMRECMKEKTLSKLLGACNYWDEAVWQCTKKERIWRRNNNPKYQKRLVELKRLPEDHYTPALWKLKREGLLNFDDEEKGCKL